MEVWFIRIRARSYGRLLQLVPCGLDVPGAPRVLGLAVAHQGRLVPGQKFRRQLEAVRLHRRQPDPDLVAVRGLDAGHRVGSSPLRHLADARLCLPSVAALLHRRVPVRAGCDVDDAVRLVEVGDAELG